MHDLGTLGGGQSGARAINDSGVVVGYSFATDERYHAFHYDGTMHDIGSLGDPSIANSVNNSGVVVGESFTSNDFETVQAFLYDGEMHDLGTPQGFFQSSAWAINDSGWIIGRATTASNFHFSFLFDGTTMWERRDRHLYPRTG